MLTLYHAPNSRASRIVQLLYELDAFDQVEVKQVDLKRANGEGHADPDNPHPEGKVPLLVHDGAVVRESNAIIQYLVELFPARSLGPKVGDPKRGPYLGWLAWYGNVMEPVVVGVVAEIEHPVYYLTFRGVAEVNAALEAALRDNPYLVGDTFTAADLLVASTYMWAPQMLPDIKVVQDWHRRCLGRPSVVAMKAHDLSVLAVAE